MATSTRQSQLCRYLSFLVLIALISGAQAGDIDPSGYERAAGEKFFLVAETPFGSDETATVRLDGPAGGAGEDADILIYRVPEPLTFLKSQHNLHRIQINAQPRPEGIANALNYVFDVWYKKTRLAWQRIFSGEARSKVVAAIPALKQAPPHSYHTEFRHDPQIKPLPGFELVDRFRYPIWKAKPVQQDAGVNMAGSSSEFIAPKQGDVKIPLGKLPPGLYLVEAAIGDHRAVTVVFVSDVIAVAKVSREQLLVWTAERHSGKPAGQAHVLFSDGVGVMQEGDTDTRGLLTIQRKVPERSYLIGEDSHGGVFVAENFYYDSEIEGDKLYAFTDRPLYQPGDAVHVKLLGRSFRDALDSSPLKAGTVTLSVLDPNGTPVTIEEMQVSPEKGGNADFRLPQEAVAGGYTLNMRYQGAAYMGSFRVAAYTKPHFDVDITTREQEYKTGRPIHARIQLRYPSGEPVKDAKVELNLRSQTLNLLGGKGYFNYYTGAQLHFPVKLAQENKTSDGDGVVEFELPPAKEPSHYILRVVCADSSAYRVSAVKEFIVESGRKLYRLTAGAHISNPGESIDFTAAPLAGTQAAAGQAVVWEALRLEDQSRVNGELKDGGFRVQFMQAGAYAVRVKDAGGEVVGQTEHWVSGSSAKLAAGGLRIDLDKDEYRDGETAHALISFRDPVDNALLTLERDAVQGAGLMTETSDWVKLTRIADNQWRADIPIRAGYAPNRVFSVLYVKDGRYNFQNKGIKVHIPAVEIAFTPDKEVYQPGDEVRVEIRTQLDGRPVSSRLAVGVVDEAVYGLQAEIAPNIQEFFQHLRRNQVRTSSSLNFHAYDMALPVERTAPPQPSYSHRPLKMLERPRRETIDTAVWLPDLKTDAEGKASFSFKMPQSLTRWRITGRAWSDQGAFGQSVAQLVSAKDFYLKWTGPSAFVAGEKPVMTLVGYNRTAESQAATFTASGDGIELNREVALQPGANYLQLPFEARRSGALKTTLAVGGKTQDVLDTMVDVVPKGWVTRYEEAVDLKPEGATVTLPQGAANVRLMPAEKGQQHFWRIAEALIDYPYGCTEQTASRLIPLSLAYAHLQALSLDPATQKTRAALRSEIANARLRLVKMAGPNSAFGWWGNQTQDNVLLTAYAYFADWQAQHTLGIAAPPATWLSLLDVYKQQAGSEDNLTQATALWLANAIGLPIKTQTRALVRRIMQAEQSQGAVEAGLLSQVLSADTAEEKTSSAAPALHRSEQLALLILDTVVDVGVYDPAARKAVDTVVRENAQNSGNALYRAVLLLDDARKGRLPDDKTVAALLAEVGPATPTLERSLVLLMLQKAVGAQPKATAEKLNFTASPAFTPAESRFGQPLWKLAESRTALTKPLSIRLSAAKPASAYLSYEVHETEIPHPLKDVQVARKLYKLERQDEEDEESGPVYEATAVEPEEEVDAAALYLDEVRVSADDGARYGAVDIPLPSGADVEAAPWGMKVSGPGFAGENSEDEAEPSDALELENTEYQAFPHRYTVPLETLTGEQRFLHLLRFSQRGEFELGKARYFEMYHPDRQALQGGDSYTLKVR
ncbi:MAG: alpha-2-macroglobulin family protein [Gammaproteobacteria bacterium]